MPMTEVVKRDQVYGRASTPRRSGVGIALFTGVVVPFLGYGTLLASHGTEGPPRWVYAAIPAAFAGLISHRLLSSVA